jgi:hypothetical protein
LGLREVALFGGPGLGSVVLIRGEPGFISRLACVSKPSLRQCTKIGRYTSANDSRLADLLAVPIQPEPGESFVIGSLDSGDIEPVESGGIGEGAVFFFSAAQNTSNDNINSSRSGIVSPDFPSAARG